MRVSVVIQWFLSVAMMVSFHLSLQTIGSACRVTSMAQMSPGTSPESQTPLRHEWSPQPARVSLAHPRLSLRAVCGCCVAEKAPVPGSIFNNAAQIGDHDLYWASMSPDRGGELTGNLHTPSVPNKSWLSAILWHRSGA
jgi:hypothetical protein